MAYKARKLKRWRGLTNSDDLGVALGEAGLRVISEVHCDLARLCHEIARQVLGDAKSVLSGLCRDAAAPCFQGSLQPPTAQRTVR